MPYGSLEVICGPMFSGKSTLLISHAKRAVATENRSSVVLKPSFDNRYAETQVVSHDGLVIDALSVAAWPTISPETEVVFIDEVQFFCAPYFDGNIVAEVKALLESGLDVVVSGLDADWRGNPFEVTAMLMAMADKVDKRVARCPVCGGNATKNFKKIKNDYVVELGESYLYESRCNKHWYC